MERDYCPQRRRRCLGELQSAKPATNKADTDLPLVSLRLHIIVRRDLPWPAL